MKYSILLERVMYSAILIMIALLMTMIMKTPTPLQRMLVTPQHAISISTRLRVDVIHRRRNQVVLRIVRKRVTIILNGLEMS
jgi:hypothetical protein